MVRSTAVSQRSGGARIPHEPASFQTFFYATAKVVSITEMIFFYLIPLLYLGKFERMAVYLFTYFFVSQGLIRATVTAHTCHNSGLFMVYHKYK